MAVAQGGSNLADVENLSAGQKYASSESEPLTPVLLAKQGGHAMGEQGACQTSTLLCLFYTSKGSIEEPTPVAEFRAASGSKLPGAWAGFENHGAATKGLFIWRVSSWKLRRKTAAHELAAH